MSSTPQPLVPTSTEPRLATVRFLDDLISGLIADNDARVEAIRSGLPRGPQIGIEPLDRALDGYFEVGLHILQATPGAGKTALALQIACDCGFPALFVSCEMPPLELFRRLIARQTGTDLGDLKGNTPSPDLERLAALTAERLPNLVMMDATTGIATLDIICETAFRMRRQFQCEHLLIVLDSLHVWARSFMGGRGGEFEIVSEGTRLATSLAATLNLPVLAICHRNRESNKKQNGGGLHGSRGSGDIEYEAWTVLDLHRDLEDREDSSGEVDVTARFYKNRSNGLIPAIKLKFCGRLQSFRAA